MNERKRAGMKREEKDPYFPVILSQIFCSAGVIALFFFALSSGECEALKNRYASLLREDYLSIELDSAVSGIKEYFSDSGAFAVFNNRVESYDESEVTASVNTSQAAEQVTSGQINQTADTSQENTESVASTDETEPAVLTGATVAYVEKEESAVPLKLSYKKKQEMIYPVNEGRYTSYFGDRTDPITEGCDYHKGVDIGADEGDSILAVLDGEVISAGEDSRSGKYIFLKHEDDTVTFYCHCSQILRQKGDTVLQGEIIALVGSTGYSTGPHLHFEVRVNDVSVDPLPLLENAD